MPEEEGFSKEGVFAKIYDDRNSDMDERYYFLRRHGSEFDASSVVERIKEITTPTVLGLDRRIYEEIDYINREREREHGGLRHRFRKFYEGHPEALEINDSLRHVNAKIGEYVKTIPQKQQQIIDHFKNEVISQSSVFISSFDSRKIISRYTSDPSTPPADDSITTIPQLHNNIVKFKKQFHKIIDEVVKFESNKHHKKPNKNQETPLNQNKEKLQNNAILLAINGPRYEIYNRAGEKKQRPTKRSRKCTWATH